MNNCTLSPLTQQNGLGGKLAGSGRSRLADEEIVNWTDHFINQYSIPERIPVRNIGMNHLLELRYNAPRGIEIGQLG